MDLLTLIQTCSVAHDVSLVLAMALTFSGGNPFTVRDVEAASLFDAAMEIGEPFSAADAPAPPPQTRDEALEQMRRLLKEGRSVVAGLLPTTPAWAKALERPIEDLVDPCAGLTIATVSVSKFEYECGPKGGRPCVLRKYGQAAGLDFFEQDVLRTMKSHEIADDHSGVAIETEAIVTGAVLVQADPKRDWGPDRIFFPAPSKRRAAIPRKSAAAQETSASGSAVRTSKPAAAVLRVPVAPVPPLPIKPVVIPVNAER